MVADGGVSYKSNRSCERTGLRLVRSQEQLVYRIAKQSYGSMNPRIPSPSENPLRWGRWDIIGHRTAYAAANPKAAYGESLVAYRRRLDSSGLAARQLSDFFAGLSLAEDITVNQQVMLEWEERNYIPPGVVTQGWRLDRRKYGLRLPHDGWFVDIEAADSIREISAALEAALANLGVSHLTVATLRGEDRAVTTAIATWVHGLYLDTGHPACGIRFGSKLGSDWECWAIWLRATDEGHPELEELREESTAEILRDDPDLQAAMDTLGLKKTW
jgi:RES domain